ncbi:MAG: hypothetical protein ACI4J1_08715 [Ruminiclostridium sp.]
MKKDFGQKAAAIFSAAGAGAAFIVTLFVFNLPVIVDVLIAMGAYAGLCLITKPRRRIGGMDVDFMENGEELENSNIETDAISRLKYNTRTALSTLNTAFCGQFEKLMRGELTDMQAELELLEQTVKMEMNK